MFLAVVEFGLTLRCLQLDLRDHRILIYRPIFFVN